MGKITRAPQRVERGPAGASGVQSKPRIVLNGIDGLGAPAGLDEMADAALFGAGGSSPYSPGEGLAIIGHELHAPITPLKMRLQQTRRRLQREEGRERDADDLAKALYHVESLQHHVAVFLDAGALMNGAFLLIPRLCDLGEITRRLCESYTSAYVGGPLRLSESARQLTGFWDGSRLDVLLRELVGNALKYTTGEVTLRLRRRGALARVEVEDCGPAPPAALRERIFEPFFTGYQTSHGLGLGLYVAHEIAARHGGRLALRVTPAGGSLFYLTLPLDEW